MALAKTRLCITAKKSQLKSLQKDLNTGTAEIVADLGRLHKRLREAVRNILSQNRRRLFLVPAKVQ